MQKVSSIVSSKIGDTLSNIKTWGSVVYNVKEYGAEGDGTDDSAAVVSAITAANGSPVYFPPGTYDLTAMSAVKGKVNLLAFGDVVIKGFNYTDLTAPAQDITANVSVNDAIFVAEGITFEGTDTVPGLQIKNQSQGTFIRSFILRKCDFRGKIGLITDNCIGSKMIDCNFIHNQYGWRSLSCTNIEVSTTDFTSPYGVGVDIATSADDTANRKGGENIKFTNCTWSDGTTAIKAVNHNYLWLVNCLIDYFTMGIYLEGSRYTRMNEVYVGHTPTSRAVYPLYVAPPASGAIYGIGNQATNRTSGIEAINCEFVGYDAFSSVVVKLDGSLTTFTGIEDCDFVACRFYSISPTSTMPYLLQIINAQDIYHEGNRYYSILNSDLTAPWVFTNTNRIFSERNNFSNCTNDSGAQISPSTGVVGNQKFESATISLSGDGTVSTNSVAYVYLNQYADIPKVTATVQTAPIATDTLNVAVAAKDGSQVFVKVTSVDGTLITAGTNNVTVDIIIMGV